MQTPRTTLVSSVIAGLCGGLCAGLLGTTLRAQDNTFLGDAVLGVMSWRSVGPVNFGGRVVDFAVHPDNFATYYVATASGGMFKTTNNGTSFEPVFESEAVISIGDVAMAPSNPDVLYVGTGEANNQRSSYWGDGVFKSTDAGVTWSRGGLRGTEHIGRIVVHPENPDIVYAAAAGALYSPNDERGLYRSRDGGRSWECVLFVSPDVGFIDVAMDPSRPDTLYAASYERRRRAHHLYESGSGSGIWKTTNGGDEWTRLEGGLPTGQIGRIGVAIFAGNSDVLYATIENRNPAPRRPRGEEDPDRESRDAGRRDADSDEAPAAPQNPRRRLVGGEIYRSDDGGESWRKTNKRSIGGRPGYYYGQIAIDPIDDKTLYVLSVSVYSSTDGGVNWKSNFARGLHSDHHAIWIDPRNPKHILIGNDGGHASTWDRGSNWDYHNDLPIGQFYAIAVDMRDPYWIYGGTQDNGTWGIPSRALTMRGLTKADAVKVNGGDGFYVSVDPTDPDIIYSESQFGAFSRVDVASGARKSIRPRAQRGSPKLRFNWMSPILISPHNPFTVYFGSQHLHRSRNRGDKWQTISADLTTNDPEKLKGNVPHCTLTTISESPLTEGLLYVGTDDGKVWMTKDGGQRWVDLTDRFEGLPQPLWVSRVEASPSNAKIAYVAFTGYREDIREPYVYLTDDGGETFRSIANNLPRSPVNVVREHPRNPDVLFLGTEFGVQVSIDAGATWSALGSDLPTTPVHDLLVHPRESDLVIGTHGRGLYVLDITPLEEMNAELLARSFHAFPPRDGRILPRGFSQGYVGARGWTGANPQLGARFRYFLAQDTDQAVSVTILDATGQELFRRDGGVTAGMHEVVWNPRGGRGRGRGALGGGRGQRRGATQRRAGPGQYVARIQHGSATVEQPFWIHGSPGMAQLFFSGQEEVENEGHRRSGGRSPQDR